MKLDSSLVKFDSTTWKFDSGTLVPNSLVATFPVDENPISQGGKWITGLTGGSWRAPHSVGGVLCANGENTDVDDSIMHANQASTAVGHDYHLTATVKRAANYVPSDGHEVELHHFEIGPGFARGIEITFQYFSDPSSQNLQGVIWNGAFNDLDLSTLGGLSVNGGGQIRDGDDLSIRKIGNQFSILHNDLVICSFTNSQFPNGNPGVGFFMRPGGIDKNYGYVKVAICSANNLITVPSQAFTSGTRAFTLTNLDPALSSFRLVLARSTWPVGQIGSVVAEVAVDGVNFKHSANLDLAGGNGTFKGRAVNHSKMVCGIPGVGQTGRAARITLANSQTLTTAINGYFY